MSEAALEIDRLCSPKCIPHFERKCEEGKSVGGDSENCEWNDFGLTQFIAGAGGEKARG